MCRHCERQTHQLSRIVGKAWDMHVTVVLETTLEENLAMIRDTVRYFKELGREVMLDAEHFFDGYKASPGYAVRCLRAAVNAGVDVLVLCDTNGGSLPWEVERITRQCTLEFPDTRVAIHAHNVSLISSAILFALREQVRTFPPCALLVSLIHLTQCFSIPFNYTNK